ncbi:MAG: hypothetical protein E3K36_07815 [Candidatus Brocadia sp.]|nr:hypothetical protein [Candidatus Brocadia sp.]
MNFIPKQHLEIGNYIKYIEEILNKCDKGIEYCKICPNEFVCSELEKDDFGLHGSTISDVLTAIQYALSKVPGYLNPDKRNELKEHIRNYINESPIHERSIWENSILDILLDDKLANLAYKPKAKTGEIRTLLTYNSRISFSISLKCLSWENEPSLRDITVPLPQEIFSNSILSVNHFVRSKHVSNIILPPTTLIKYGMERDVAEIVRRCNLNEAGLAAAFCYYALLTKSPIPENIAITGGLDSHGRAHHMESLDDKIETVFRELHFIDKVIIPKGAFLNIPVPHNICITEVNNLKQALDIVFK